MNDRTKGAGDDRTREQEKLTEEPVRMGNDTPAPDQLLGNRATPAGDNRGVLPAK